MFEDTWSLVPQGESLVGDEVTDGPPPASVCAPSGGSAYW
jgi:hypothetical protein